MTVIWDAVKARFGDELLINLTNPQKPEATTIDDTRGEAAVTDVEGDLQTYCGINYNDWTAANEPTAPLNSVAVDGVVAKLTVRTGAGGISATDAHDKYIDRLKEVARITGRDRISPRTDSVMTPTSHQIGDEIVRPSFDWPKFDDFIPNGPADNKNRND
jgi:hypothetical protein